MADGVGFEPTRSVNPCRFSRPVPSTARAPIRSVVLSQVTYIQAIGFASFIPETPEVVGFASYRIWIFFPACAGMTAGRCFFVIPAKAVHGRGPRPTVAQGTVAGRAIVPLGSPPPGRGRFRVGVDGIAVGFVALTLSLSRRREREPGSAVQRTGNDIPGHRGRAKLCM